MKRILLSSIAVVFIAFNSMAQTSSLTFFTPEGEKFWVVLNGLRQNVDAQTNVKLEPFASGVYKAKIIFQDTALGETSQSVNLMDHTAMTYQIKKKEQTALGNKVNSVSHTIAKDANMKQPDKSDEKPELYKVTLLSQSAYGNSSSTIGNYNTQPTQTTTVVTQQPPQTTVVTQQQPQQVVVVQQQPQVVGGTVVQQTTTTTGGGYPSDNVNMNVGVGVGGVGMNMNVNVNDNTSYSQSSSTTTTTVVGGGYPQQSSTIVYVPGYAGPVGCAMPMNSSDFASAKSTISSQSFASSKVTVAKQVANSNCFTADQVKELVQLMDFESDKLEVAKYCYTHTYDKGNYFKINDAFDFSSSIDELNNYIGGH